MLQRGYHIPKAKSILANTFQKQLKKLFQYLTSLPPILKAVLKLFPYAVQKRGLVSRQQVVDLC